jgi:TonB family protein
VKTTSQLLVTFLLNASWQILLIAAAAALCDWLLRGTPARYRHAVWVAALWLSLLAPALVVSSHFNRSATVSHVAAPKIEPAPVVITTIRSIEGEVIEPADVKTPVTAAKTEQPKVPGNSLLPIRLNRNVALALVALYALFVLYAAVRFVRAWRRTRKLVSSAFPYEVPDSVQAIVQACERAINARARIVCSHAVAVPITVGTLRPLIILPASFRRETDQEILTSAIGHELVHVARRDYLTNLIYEFVFLPLSFHPAAMLMRRRIRQTRELCCDEWVASKLLKPEVYARSLVRLIGAVPVTRRLAADTTIGIAESDNLEVRIMSLLKMRRLSKLRKALLLISAVVLLSVPCLTATSFALSFEIKGQEPQKSGETKEKLQLPDEQSLRVELERQVQHLRELEQRAPVAQKAEIEARIREVQKVLEEHETLLQKYEKHKEYPADVEARFNEVRKNLETHARMLELYRKQNPELENSREAQKKMEALLEKYSESASARELQKVDQLYQEMIAKSAQQGTRNAKVIYRVEPTYPYDAREKKITGSVVLTVTVGHDGLPQSIQVKKPLYPSMDQAAIEAARKMRFEPAMKDGQIVSQVLLVEFYFSLESKHIEVMASGAGSGQGAGEGSGQGVGYAKSESGGVGYGSGVRTMRRERSEQDPQDRERRQAELVQGAVISMDRAVQIATSKYPGKVLAASLGRDKDGPVFYHLVIINTEGDKRTVKYVWVSAIDGTIIKSEDELPRKMSAISGGALNGKAITLPPPKYPEIARAANAEGNVTVQITIDEEGNVISATAVSGHPLLQGAAVAAARQAKFSPTKLQGEPVKVTGQITYNFVVQ